MTASPTSVYGANLTSKQEATLVYTFEEDPDLWLVLLSEYISAKGSNSEKLKQGMIEDTAEWRAMVDRVKEKGFNDIKDLAGDKMITWNMRIKQLLSDPGHVNILKFYLKTLISLRTKRVADVGYKAQAKKQINSVLSFVANEMFVSLDKFSDSSACLVNGTTPSGHEMTPTLRQFYTEMQTENLSHASAMLGIIVIFKNSHSTSDIEKLQRFIKTSVLKPLESRAEGLKGQEEKTVRDRVKLYYQLLQAVEISFD